MRAYGARYLKDLWSFTKAYSLALVALLPLILLSFGVVGVLFYVVLLVVGGLNIVLFTAVTAVLDNYGYKFVVYLTAVAINGFTFGTTFSFQPLGMANVNLLIFGQIAFTFGLFYLVMERARIGAWVRASWEPDV